MPKLTGRTQIINSLQDDKLVFSLKAYITNVWLIDGCSRIPYSDLSCAIFVTNYQQFLLIVEKYTGYISDRSRHKTEGLRYENRVQGTSKNHLARGILTNYTDGNSWSE